ncbi:MAG TPA: GAF domain-containing protein, partial [Ktedonobacterales bacterium]
MTASTRDEDRMALSRLHTLRAMNAVANSALPLETELQRAAELVAQELDADLCAIWLFSPDTNELILHTTNGPRPRAGMVVRRALGEGYSGWVAKEGVQLIVEDALAHDAYREEA